MKGSQLIFDNVDVLYYNLNEISLNRGGSYINSPEWLKNKKATINPRNNDDKFFQYAITVALCYNCVFIDQYNWKEIFHQIEKTGKSLNQIINQLLLISYMYLIIVKK